MLRRTVSRLGGHGHGHGHGVPVEEMYPHGVPKRTFPLRDHPKHPALAPSPGGWFLGKHTLGIPIHIPYEANFWRLPFLFTCLCIMYDNAFGCPIVFDNEKMPGRASHFFFNNNGGKPHHFWQFQDGWYIPNHSGVKRLYE
mgnify:FL=1